MHESRDTLAASRLVFQNSFFRRGAGISVSRDPKALTFRQGQRHTKFGNRHFGDFLPNLLS